MKMVSVSSTAISAVGYDSTSSKMRIRFSQGRSYDFCGVPQSIFEGLISSSSKGQYYSAYIRDSYQCF